VNIYLGSHPATKHVVGSDNNILMIGQYALGELKVGLTVYAFEDEGYKRPVLCNAYPHSSLVTKVAGRDWHPFVHASHPRSLKYLECEKLALDHADSLREPEAIECSLNGTVKGHVDISPVESLYIMGADNKDKDGSLVFKEYNFDHAGIRIA